MATKQAALAQSALAPAVEAVGQVRKVQQELRAFSKESVGDRDEDAGVIDFMKYYPTIFECLETTFAYMPSASRIVEQLHGALRDSLNKAVSLSRTNHDRQYMMNTEHFS